MEEDKKQHLTDSCARDPIPAHRIEMLKQKISFYRFMFVQYFTIAVGLSAFYYHYILGSESTTSDQMSLLKMILIEPEIAVPVAIVFLMFMMMQAFSLIYICIGELGDPGAKRIGYSMSLGSIFVPIEILALVWMGVLPGSMSGSDRLDIILWGLMLYVAFVVVFHATMYMKDRRRFGMTPV